MTPLELIDETIDFYGADPKGRRARNWLGCCEYITRDGKMCAIGRCLENNFRRQAWACSFCYVLTKMKPEYRIDDFTFWTNLQRLHDIHDYWDEKGLTKQGVKFANYMRRTYK